jgi:serine/threonine-protein kinase
MDNEPLQALPPPDQSTDAPPDTLVGKDTSEAAEDTRPPARSARKKARAKPITGNAVDGMMATQITENLAELAQANRLHASPKISLSGQEQRPVLEDFRIVRKVGEGAMANVYQARQLSASREVALKVLFPHTARNPRMRERFYLEGRILARLNHPNMVRGYAVGEENGLHYFAMEFIDGRSLQKWLNLLGKLSVPDALHITLACARALQYAHGLELVHRDIKPDNILITRQGQVKITDLGVVKQVGDDLSLTQTGNGIGTPCYMPLEQARNAKDTDGRSDIYALGCVLYCMLTGRPPFLGENLVELLQAKQVGRFTVARKYNDAVPERLDLIIDKMLAKQVRFRYQTCDEVIKDLEGLKLAGTAISFIPSETTTTALGPADTATIPRPATPPARPTPTPAPVPAAPSAPPRSQPDESEGDWWYVNYKTGEGQLVTRKLTTEQVLELLENEHFDLHAKASRSLRENYRSLAALKEFQPALRSRIAKLMADRKAARFRHLYKKLDEEDQIRNPDRDQDRDAVDNGSNWPLYLYLIAAVSIAFGLGFALLRLLLHGVPSPLQ